MRLFLLVLLLAAHVAVFSDNSGAEEILTNPAVLDENDSGRVIQKMARSVEASLKAFSESLKSAVTDLKYFMLGIRATSAKTAVSLPSVRAKGWYCSPPFVKQASMCLFAKCRAAKMSVARQTCSDKGGDLIWLDSRNDHEEVNAFFKKSCSSASQYWTSLRGNKYTAARILNRYYKSLASNPSSLTLRGQPPISKLAFACRQAPKVDEEDFLPVRLKDVDIGAFGVNLGPLEMSSCSAACVSRGPTCLAFHLSSFGNCFVIEEKDAELWIMVKSVPYSLYFVRRSNIVPSCTSEKFPYTHGASRYRFERVKMTWWAARSKCEAKGGKLAELTTPAERSLNVYRRRSEYTYIGMKQIKGSKEPKEGWIWYSSGTPVTGWEKDEPNNWNGTENVGSLEFPKGKLNDIKGEERRTSICECAIVS